MSDIQSFVTRLLSMPPGDPDSIHLEVDTEGDVAALFEVLLTIMTSILKAWYTPPIHISRLSPRDLEKLQRYFASFGIVFHLDIQPTPHVLRINNRAYESQRNLKDMKFQVTHEGSLYTVHFEFM